MVLMKFPIKDMLFVLLLCSGFPLLAYENSEIKQIVKDGQKLYEQRQKLEPERKNHQSLWSQDGQYLYLLKNDQGGELLHFELKSGKKRRLAKLKELRELSGKKNAAINMLTEKAGNLYLLLGDKWWAFNKRKWQTASKAQTLAMDRLWHPKHEQKLGSQNIGLPLVFRNNSQEKLNLQFMRGGKAAQAPRYIEAGQSFYIQTYRGHQWQIQNLQGEKLYGFSVPKGGCITSWPQEKIEEKPKAVAKKTLKLSIKNKNLWVENKQLSHDGQAKVFYHSPRLSPNSQYILVCRNKQPDQATRQVTFIESSPADQLQPKLKRINYLKPGDELDQRELVLFDLKQDREIRLNNKSFWNEVWNVQIMEWSQDSKTCFVLVQHRGHSRRSVLAVDVSTGKLRTVIDEKSKSFIDYSNKTWWQFIKSGKELLWMTEERHGWNHIYRIDTATGKQINSVSRGRFVVKRVEEVNEKKDYVLLTVLDVRKGQNPYYHHLMRVRLDGKQQVLLTRSNGTHSWSISPNSQYFTCVWSRVDHPPVTELRSMKTGRLIAELHRDELVKNKIPLPQRFVAKGRDGKTDIHGIIIRPSFYKKGMRLPVIENIYAGPHGQFCPKSWNSIYHQNFKIAELGFAVVIIDGMGTNWRSKKFHDVAWKNLMDAGFPDRKLWIKAAAKAHPELDISRVGLFGTSAGGQNTLAGLLHHGDFYKAGVSSCGCHDNRMDKIWWNEAWMGWPIAKHYAENSNVTHAHKLQVPLLLTVGELDDNVDPSSTYQVVDALIKADRDFDFIMVPGGGHFIISSKYVERRMFEFFIKHLGPVPKPK